MNSKNLTIGVLSTTAVILLVGVLTVSTRPLPVLADGMTTYGGDYVLTVGRLNTPDEEHVYVLDTSARKLVVYRLDPGRRQIEIVQGIDLEQLEGRQDQSGQPASKPPSGGRRP